MDLTQSSSPVLKARPGVNEAKERAWLPVGRTGYSYSTSMHRGAVRSLTSCSWWGRAPTISCRALPALFSFDAERFTGRCVCPAAAATAAATTTAIGTGPGPLSGGAVLAKRGRTLHTSLSPRSKRRARSAALSRRWTQQPTFCFVLCFRGLPRSHGGRAHRRFCWLHWALKPLDRRPPRIDATAAALWQRRSCLPVLAGNDPDSRGPPSSANASFVWFRCCVPSRCLAPWWVRGGGGGRTDARGDRVSQNVDGLHQKAGSRNVVDLHGRNDKVR